MDCHQILVEELWHHAKIRLHHGKTAVWNCRGEVPPDIGALERAARITDPSARVWRGGIHSVPEERGITILGVPVSTAEFVLRQLEVKAEEHQALLQRILDIKELQCAWLVLLYCAGARANFYIRTVSPSLSHAFATQRDTQIWRCFCALVGVDPGAIACSAKAAADLPLAMGGLGLRSAVKLRHAAHWASWADAIQMIAERHPEIAGTIVRAIHTEHEVPGVQAIVTSVEADGFVCPSWEDLATGEVSASPEEDEDPNQPRAGWQSKAAREVEARSFARLLSTLTDPQKALLRSQGGPLASALFISMPIDRVSRIDSQSFRLLFLRRLRQPLPLTARSCRCGRLLDCLGHHRSACPVAGVLGRIPLS